MTLPAPLAAGEIETREDVAQKALANTLLSPKFYSTDYAAMDKLDVSSVRAEWDEMLAEYEGDNNHDHFQRTPEFAEEVKALPDEIRQEFPRLPDQLHHVGVLRLRASTTRSRRTSRTPTSSS